MAEHLDVNTDVLHGIAGRFDVASHEVDELSLPDAVDGGIASGDIHLLLADVSLDLAELAGGLDAMSQLLLDTQQLYLDRDEHAAETLIMVAGAE